MSRVATRQLFLVMQKALWFFNSRYCSWYFSMFIKNSLEPGLNDQELIHAITGGRAFRVVLQPQHDLLTGALVGAEALARWDHPQHGEIAPSLFIPALTQLGASPGCSNRWSGRSRRYCGCWSKRMRHARFQSTPRWRRCRFQASCASLSAA